MRHLVLTRWDVQQAHLAPALMKDAHDAVCAVHGEGMAKRIADVPRHRWSEFMSDEDNWEDVIPI